MIRAADCTSRLDVLAVANVLLVVEIVRFRPISLVEWLSLCYDSSQSGLQPLVSASGVYFSTYPSALKWFGRQHFVLKLIGYRCYTDRLKQSR